jgi:hypothetical protein
MNWKNFDGGCEAETPGGKYRIEQMQAVDDRGVWYRITWNDTPVSSTRTLSAAKATAETDAMLRSKGQ